MPKFNKGIRTVAGQNLFGRMDSGMTGIHYTKIVYSSLDLSNKTDDEIAQMTDVQPQELVIPNPSVLFKPKTATTDPETEIRAYGSNQNLSKGFYINTYALYAKDDDGKEILLGVTLDDHPSWLPAYDGVRPQALTYNWDISNKNGTDNVKFTDAHDEYATYGDYQTFSEAVGSQLNSAVNHASSYAGNANYLSGSVSSNSSNINNLSSSVNSIYSDELEGGEFIGGLNSRIDTISSSNADNSSDITAMKGKLSDVANNTSVSTAISNVSNATNTLSSSVSANSSANASLSNAMILGSEYLDTTHHSYPPMLIGKSLGSQVAENARKGAETSIGVSSLADSMDSLTSSSTADNNISALSNSVSANSSNINSVTNETNSVVNSDIPSLSSFVDYENNNINDFSFLLYGTDGKDLRPSANNTIDVPSLMTPDGYHLWGYYLSQNGNITFKGLPNGMNNSDTILLLGFDDVGILIDFTMSLTYLITIDGSNSTPISMMPIINLDGYVKQSDLDNDLSNFVTNDSLNSYETQDNANNKLANYATKSDLSQNISNVSRPKHISTNGTVDMDNISDGIYLVLSPKVTHGPTNLKGCSVKISSFTNSGGDVCQKIINYSSGILYTRQYYQGAQDNGEYPWYAFHGSLVNP